MARKMDEQKERSPYWGSTTKLVIGLTIVAIIGALLVRFQNLIGPLILTFILTFILHPLASALVNHTRMSWRMAVNLIFLVLLVIIALTATATSLAVINQLQALLQLVQKFIIQLPALLTELSSSDVVYTVPLVNYQISISQTIEELNIDLIAVGQQILSVVQPLLGQAGGVLGALATSALSGIGWGIFILVISYFILSDAGQVPDFIRSLELPGHLDDFRRLGRELARIWDAFLRGQLLLFAMIVVTYLLLFSVLGVNTALGLALLAGLAKFVPYIGPLVAGVTTAIVAFFQGSNYLGIPPFTFAIIAVVAAVVLDQIFDNLITPRMFGDALGVHPAAVLVTALVAASLIGVIGLLLAAPVLASVQLFGRYLLRKMLDLDPWPEPESERVQIHWPLEKQLGTMGNRFIQWAQKRRKNERSE